VYPLILVPFIWLGELLPDPTGEAAVRLLRATPLAFSLGCIAVSAGIARVLSGRIAALTAALVLAGNPIFNQLSVSPFAEMPATFGVLAATLLAIRVRPSFVAGVAAGIALGLACTARYQSLAFIAPFGLWMLLSVHRPRLGGFVVGLGACVVLQGILDWLAYGAPFHSLIQSAAYNVTTDEAASFYGAEPFGWYLATIGDWLGYPTAVLALVGIGATWKSPKRWEWALVLGLAATMLIWLSAIAHKEPRFTSQVMPFLAIAAGHGVWLLARLRPPLGAVAAAPALVLATLPGVWQSLTLDLTFNPGFVEGPKLVALQRPDAVLGTIPWFIARPYSYGRIELVRADVDAWNDRAYMESVIERADYLLLREYDFATDRAIARLVDAQFRSLETYPEQVVLLERRRPRR
jgi:4-amino-4-deoxy-L-arabinose transferase-like glycosyltransferase